METYENVPAPGDESDGTCTECGAPLNEQDRCPDPKCCEATKRQYTEAELGTGWCCSQACGWCGRC